MAENETERAMEKRHLAEAEERIADQKRLIAKLEASGADVTLANDLLAEFEKTRDLAAHHLGRL